MRKNVEEHDFYIWLSSMTRVAFQRYRERNTSGIVQILNRYRAMNGIARTDPLLSTLETATMHVIALLAQSHIDDLRFETGFKLLDLAAQVLFNKIDRIRISGNPPRPDSVAWCCLIDTLADAQWKAPEQYREAVLTLDNMIYRWRLAEESIRRGIRLFPRDEAGNRNLIDILAGSGCQIMRAIMRHDPALLTRFREIFTSYHGDILGNKELPYYWETQITEMHVSGNINPALLSEYYQQLVSKARHQNPELDRTANDHALANEERYILRERRRNFVLLTD